MKIVKRKTGCWCHNCDNRESEYTISNNGGFKVFWANGENDSEISFCEDCAKDLLRQLSDLISIDGW